MAPFITYMLVAGASQREIFLNADHILKASYDETKEELHIFVDMKPNGKHAFEEHILKGREAVEAVARLRSLS